MERNWMQNPDRLSTEYITGVNNFLAFASSFEDQRGGIPCPCKKCNNVLHLTKEEVRAHLIMNGMVKSYTKWYYHGESSVQGVCSVNESMMEGGCDSTTDLIKDVTGPEIMDVLMSDVQDRGNVGSNPDEPTKYNEATSRFFRLLEDAEQKLYPGCENFTKLTFIVKLFQIKCLFGISDIAINKILKLFKEALPSGETLPNSFYKARKIIKDFGLDYKEIDACRNDCMLFWKEHEDALQCLKCSAPRYKDVSEQDKCMKSKKKKQVAHKVLRYFPLKPRLQRLFMSPEVASDMRWHHDERLKDGILRHPADSVVWKSFDKLNPGFAIEPRNVRIGLSADGVNPFGDMSSSHSTWPVVVTAYNLPPWMCMKQSYCMLSLLIPGPKAPGNDIDVYLQPLVEELKELWYYGADTYDASKKEIFRMRVALLWTINDFPAYANLSGWSTKGALACPSCHKETHSIRLKHGRKFTYMGARRFLSSGHRWRDDKRSFDGKVEHRSPPTPLSGDQVLKQVENLQFQEFGKGEKKNKKYDSKIYLNWRKKSIFFQLPYWKRILVRHNLDVMHIEKNICDNIIGTLLDMEGKTKDGLNARRDLKLMRIRKKLHLEEKDGKISIPPACYNLSLAQKKKLCRFLKDVKVPDGFSSNVSRCVSLKDHKIIGLKSHDSHIILERLLSPALRGIVLPSVYDAITELCIYFRELCSKELSVDVLEHLNSTIPTTLCKLERLFPPSFFDVMVHLAVHLANEAKLAGPVQFRWMYPIERFLRKLKCYVRNKTRPEGSIAEGYIVEESIIFCSRYLQGIETPFNKLERNTGGSHVDSSTKLSVFSQVGYPLTKTESRLLEGLEREQALTYVLNNCEEVQPFMREYEKEAHNIAFHQWFYNKASELCKDKDELTRKQLVSLAQGPLVGVERFNGYVINGFIFHTEELEKKRVRQNSGVSLKGVSDSTTMDYYGVITEMLELQYLGGNRIVLFKCDWWDVASIGRGVKIDKHGFVSVNSSRKLSTNEPFVLASQVEQVFYVEDGLNPNWLLIMKGQSHSSFDSISTDQSGNELPYEQEDAFQQGMSEFPHIRTFGDDELISWERESPKYDCMVHIDSDDTDSNNDSDNGEDEDDSCYDEDDEDDFLL